RHEHGALPRHGEAVEGMRDRTVFVHAQVTDEALAAVERAREREVRGEESAFGLGLGRGPREIDLAGGRHYETGRMMERLDGKAVGIHTHRLRRARAKPRHV